MGQALERNCLSLTLTEAGLEGAVRVVQVGLRPLRQAEGDPPLAGGRYCSHLPTMSKPETQIPQSIKLGASRLLPGQGGTVLRPGPTGCTAPGHQGQWGIAKRGRLGLQ